LGGKIILKALKPRNISWLDHFQVHVNVFNIPT